MGQESNDIEQLKEARNDLANVYKSQVLDKIKDNGNITHIHNAILEVETAIAILESRIK